MRHILLISSLLLFPAVTYAQGIDPWCLVRDEAEICGYQTKEACYAKAQYGGFCRQNTRFMGVSGERRWCVVTDTRRNCAYSRNMCLKVAQEVGGGCVENTELALKKSRIGGSIEDEEDGFDFEGSIVDSPY